MIVANGVFSVQYTFGWIIAVREASPASGERVPGVAAQKLRTKVASDGSGLVRVPSSKTSPSWLPGMPMIGSG